MQIKPYSCYNNSYNVLSPNRVKYNNTNVNFGNQNQKKLIELLACENLRKFKLRFSEAMGILQMQGFKVTRNTGSHAKIHVPGYKTHLPIVDPHEGSEKYVHHTDLKRIILLVTGQTDEAFRLAGGCQK